MCKFVKEIDNIYRLMIPFMSVYTSVFLVVSDQGLFLVDCATTESDVKDHIIKALNDIGYDIADVTALIITHDHSDHSGGLQTILSLAPDIKVIKDEQTLCDGVCIYPLPGHTADFVGLFDERSGTLITGDGIQGAGIGKFRCSLETKEGYLQSLEKIKCDLRIKNLLFSHEYEPWYKNSMMGRESVLNCLSDCMDYVK